MKVESDHESTNDLGVHRPGFKMTGGFLVTMGLAILVLDPYWSPSIGNLLYRLGVEPINVQYIMYILGYSPYLLIAVGGFMLFKSKKGFLRPAQKETEEEGL